MINLKWYVRGLFLYLCFIFQGVALDVGPNLQEKIRETFFENGKISPHKVDSFKLRLIKKIEDSETLISEDEKAKGKSKAEIDKKIAKEDQVSLLREEVNVLESIRQSKPDLDSLARLILIDSATSVVGRRRPIPAAIANVVSVFKSWEFPIDKDTLTPSDRDSMFYAQTGTVVPRAGLLFGANEKLYEKADVVFPEEGTILEYKKFRASQTKPKFDVVVNVNGKKREFKVKLALETHSEISAAALAATVGLYTDLSRNYSTVVVRFKSAEEFDSMLLEWNAYYSKYDPKKYIIKTADAKLFKQNADSSVDVTFSKALLEAKDIKGIARLGEWSWKQPEVKDSAVSRSMLLFNFWVGNPDFETKNNKVLVNSSGDLFYIQHDLGFAFTSLLAEALNTFRPDIVERKKSTVDFKFFSWVNREDFKQVKYSDLKWMAERIAKLSREQITKAVELGNWPKSVSEYLTERLIQRRNNITEAFLLDEKYPSLAERGNFNTKDLSVIGGNLKQFLFEGYPERLGTSTWGILQERVFPPVREAATDLMAEGLSLIESIPGDNIQVNNTLFGNLRVKSVRTIEKNPNAKKSSELFIVKDDVTLGAELGADFVLGGKVATLWRYSLIYPKSTYKEARNADGFWLNLRSPTAMDFSKVPESSILIAEKAVEGSGLIRTDKMTGYFPVGMQVDSAYIPLKRVMISRRSQGEVKVAIDRESSGRYGSELYANLGFLRMSFANKSFQRGKASREAFTVKETDVQNSAALRSELDEVIREMDLDEARELTSHKSDSLFYDNIFKVNKSGYNFWLYGKKVQYREDKTTDRQSKEVSSDYTREKLKKWLWLDNGEQRKLYTRAHSGTSQMIHMNIVINDKETKASEAEKQLMEFVRNTFDGKIKTFSPELHSSNGLYGATQMISNVVLTEKAINALAAINFNEYVAYAESQFQKSWLMEGFGLWGSDYQHRRSARSSKEFFIELKNSKAGSPERVKLAEQVLNNSLLAVDGAWSGKLLGWILKKVSERTNGEGLYYNCFFGPAPFTENNFPVDKPLRGEFGVKPESVEKVFQGTDQMSPLQIYAK